MKTRFVLEKATVEAGGVVKGWLKLPKNTKERRGHLLDCLSMYFTGEECTAVEHWNRQRKRERLDKKIAREERRFLKIKVESRFAEVEECDEFHKVPFRVALPPSIPSTMHVKDRNSKASVVYYIRAHFGVCFGTNHPHKEVCVLAETQPKLEIPYMIQQNTQQLKSFSLCTRGHIAYGAKIFNTQLRPGEKVKVQMFIINSSLIKIKAIHLELIQVVRYVAEDARRQKTVQILCQAVFNKTGGQKYIEPGFATEDPQRRYQETLAQLNKPPTKKTKTLDLPPIPETACDSYEGHSIRVSHEVRVTITTKSLNNTIEIRFPVTLVKSITEVKKKKEPAPGEQAPRRPELATLRQVSRISKRGCLLDASEKGH